MTAVTLFNHNVTDYVLIKNKKVPLRQSIERWIIGDNEICLIKEENQLSYERVDKRTGKSTRGNIGTGNLSLEDTISYLLHCQPIISSTGEIKFSPSPPLSYIQRWIMDDKEVYFLRNNDQLNYQIIDHSTGQSTLGSIPIKNCPIDDAIEFLSNCQPVILKGQPISFLPNHPICYTWAFRNKIVRLLQNKEDLIWEVFDDSTKTVSQAPFKTAALDYDRFSEWYKCNPLSMTDYLEKHTHHKTASSCLDLFEDCEVEKLEMTSTPQSPIDRVKAVYAKKIVGKSELDPSVPIDHRKWAISLILTGESSVANPLTWAGHAALIIEGRDQGAFFKYIVHLVFREGCSKVILNNLTNKKITYVQKGDTWPVKAIVAKKMLEAVKWELQKQLEGDPQIDFDLRGSESKSVKPRKVKQYKTYSELVTDVFGPYFLSLPTLSTTPICYKSIILRDRNGEERTLNNSKFKTIGKEFASPQQVFIRNKSGDGWTEVRIPDNCMTWAIRKLVDCGIYMKKDKFSTYLTAPKRQVAKDNSEQDHCFFRKANHSPRSPHLYKILGKIDLKPLHDAITSGEVKLVENLLDKLVKLQDADGYNALHKACIEKNFEIVKLLVNKGMNINEPAENSTHSVPLYLVLRHYNSDKDIVEYLVNAGVDLMIKVNENGDTLLHLLAEHKFSTWLKLSKLNGNLNIKNNEGETPLIVAAKNANVNMVFILTRNNVSQDEKNNVGKSALSYVRCSRRPSRKQLMIGNILIHSGAKASMEDEKDLLKKYEKAKNRAGIIKVSFIYSDYNPNYASVINETIDELKTRLAKRNIA